MTWTRFYLVGAFHSSSILKFMAPYYLEEGTFDCFPFYSKRIIMIERYISLYEGICFDWTTSGCIMMRGVLSNPVR